MMTRQEIRRQVLALLSARHTPGDGALTAHELLVDDLVSRMHEDQVFASQVTAELLSVVDTALERLAAQNDVTPRQEWGLMHDELVLMDIWIGERLLKDHGV